MQLAPGVDLSLATSSRPGPPRRLRLFGRADKPMSLRLTAGDLEGSQCFLTTGSVILGFLSHRFQERFWAGRQMWGRRDELERRGSKHETRLYHSTFNLVRPILPARRFLLRPCFTIIVVDTITNTWFTTVCHESDCSEVRQIEWSEVVYASRASRVSLL